MVQQRVRRIHLQRQHLTFYWTDRGETSRWNPGDLARPGPGGQHNNIRRFAAVLGHRRDYTSAGDLNLSDRIVLVNYGSGLAGRLGESSGQPAVVDLVISRAEDGAGNARPQVRLSPPRLRSRQPFELEPEAFLKIKGEAQLLGVVAGQSDDDCTLVAIADRDAGYRLEFARKIRPHALAFERQGEQRLLTGLGLDRGGEHSGGRPARASSGFGTVVDGHRATRLGQPPGNPQPHDPGADDDGLRAKRRYGDGRGNSGLPSPGKPGQVQWV